MIAGASILGTPSTKAAYKFFHEATVGLADIEATGIRIDRDHLKKATKETKQKVKDLSADFYKNTEIGKRLKKTYRKKASLSAGDQLATIVYDQMNEKVTVRTKSGAPAVDEKALSKMKCDGIDELLHIRKLDKAVNTYLKGIERETVGDLLYPSYALNFVQSYRSSAVDPNSQNWPIRNKELGELIRKCFIPREGQYFGEADYSGLEVHIAACYHKDPMMLKYLIDPTTDMHKDVGAECFILPPDQVTKTTRYTAKNGFVFPEFYGSYHVEVAKNMWDMITELDLMTTSGMPMLRHLASKGVKSLSQFTKHIKGIEKHFWEERFPVYTQWKEDHYREYQKKGFFVSKTGFVYQGALRRNQVINFPVQGSAFHCLLWSAIRVNKELRKRGMKSRIIGQIHDSMVLSIWSDEVDELFDLIWRVSCVDLRKHWKWINVPLEVEFEMAPKNASWFSKQEVPFTYGKGPDLKAWKKAIKG